MGETIPRRVDDIGGMNNLTLQGGDVAKLINLLREVITGPTTIESRVTALRIIDLAYDRPQYASVSDIGPFGVTLRIPTTRETVAVSEKGFAEIEQYLREGKKIQAIKTLRAETGIGLKEAKDFIELSEQTSRIRSAFP
jgi:ribosomal protein L7/L12